MCKPTVKYIDQSYVTILHSYGNYSGELFAIIACTSYSYISIVTIVIKNKYDC